MKRREAIQNMFLLSAGVALLPNCQMEEQGPIYANVPLEKGQRTLMNLLTDAILPRAGTEVTTPETTTDFILTMLNDCTSSEDIQKYLLKKMAPEKQLELFSNLGESEKMTDAAKAFFNQTAWMTRQHFTSSEYFMKNRLDFEFAPGRYLGCEPV